MAAVALLGAVVATASDDRCVRLRLTEVEAYEGSDDPASHAHGRRTERNGPMFGPAGTLYVYLSYGIHWCVNIVVGLDEDPAAVLLRSAQIVEGRDVIEHRRSRTDRLTDGPGKLGQALGLDGTASGSTVWAGPLRLEGPLGSVTNWTSTPRIGISKATERRWRFVASE